MPATTHAREAELAARWLAGVWRGATLQSEGGETYRVVFEGRRGGGAGPDFRDAVLMRADGTHLYGDIELHLRPTGWYAHGHASDPRYNGLALHVVLTRSARDPTRTPLASGRAVPLVVLGEAPPDPLPELLALWPCDGLPLEMVAELLQTAGMARFAEHTSRFERELRPGVAAAGGWDVPSRVLWLAMTEALGYGRDRAALRRLGEALIGALIDAPPISLEGSSLPGIERMRARGLLAWHARWRHAGPWAVLEPVLRIEQPRSAVKALIAALRVADRGAVSPGRAAIVAVNVVLPFAAAYGSVYGDDALVGQSQDIYRAWPGLSSNQIVREMARTLGLARLPRGALAQQGLQHLWQRMCREKRCERCPCNCRHMLH